MAFNWLEIEALKKGHLEKSKSKIKERYLNDFKKAKTIEKNNQLLMASEHYDRILNTYSSFFNLDSMRQELQNIKKSKRYLNALKVREKAFEKEDVLSSFFLNRFDKDYKNPKKTSLKWWNREFEKLKTQEAKANIQIIKMYERVRFNIVVTVHSTSKQYNTNMSQQQHLFCESLISLALSK